jgi:hypothetical protein
MIRSLLVSVVALTLGGCATVSGTPAGAATSSSAYETMASNPPEPRKEDAPRLQAKEVWVPGYYQPMANTWVWHQGEVRDAKVGYTLLPASYHQENGRVAFSPPRWRRADLAQQTATANAAH